MSKKYSPTNFEKKRVREQIIKNHFEKLSLIRNVYNKHMNRWHEKTVMFFFRLGGYKERFSILLNRFMINGFIQFFAKIIILSALSIYCYNSEWVYSWFLFGFVFFVMYANFFHLSQFIQSFAALSIHIISNHPPIVEVYSYGSWNRGVAMFFFNKGFNSIGKLISFGNSEESILHHHRELIFSNKVVDIKNLKERKSK